MSVRAERARKVQRRGRISARVPAPRRARAARWGDPGRDRLASRLRERDHVRAEVERLGNGDLGRGTPGEQLRDAGEVLLEGTQHRGRVERRGGMVERVEDDREPADLRRLRLAVDAGDAVLLAREELRREVAERRHELRLDQRELAEEVGLAGLDLVGHRVAVAGRAALEHVRDIHVLRGTCRCRRGACRAACPRRPRTGSPAGPRGSRAPRRRRRGRRRSLRPRTRPGCVPGPVGNACNQRPPRRARRARSSGSAGQRSRDPVASRGRRRPPAQSAAARSRQWQPQPPPQQPPPAEGPPKLGCSAVP